MRKYYKQIVEETGLPYTVKKVFFDAHQHLKKKESQLIKKRKMKSPNSCFNSGNSLVCHFQHFGARERESKAQSSMQPRLPP